MHVATQNSKSCRARNKIPRAHAGTRLNGTGETSSLKQGPGGWGHLTNFPRFNQGFLHILKKKKKKTGPKGHMRSTRVHTGPEKPKGTNSEGSRQETTHRPSSACLQTPLEHRIGKHHCPQGKHSRVRLLLQASGPVCFCQLIKTQPGFTSVSP